MKFEKTIEKTTGNIWLATDHRALVLTALFMALSFATPLVFGHTSNNQIITGILVNTILVLALLETVLANAMAVAILPSSAALASGIIAPVLAPLIPLVIGANRIFVSVFHFLKKRPIAAALGASICKFAVFFLALSFLPISAPAAKITFGGIQLATALAGSLLALGIMRVISRR